MVRKKPKKVIKKPLAKVEPEGIKKTKIRVIGIGGGGGSVVSEIASRMKKASFVVANTDRQALKVASRRAVRFQFGQSFTQGLGTGMNADLGREAAQNEKEKIKKLLAGYDFCILVSCLGGGAGSGAAPIFAKIARNLGLITYGIFTLPFRFEGEKKTEIAKESLQKLKSNLNAISIIPNERIFQVIDKSTPLKGALSAINKNLAESLGGLIETIYLPGLINIDFADLRTILQGQGRLAFLNTVEVQGANRGLESIKKVISSPLYPYTIRGARGILFNIAGEKELSLAEVSQISKTISDLVNKEAKIIFGISQSKKYQDKIKVILLATGCGTKIFPSKPRKRRLRKKFVEKASLPEEKPQIAKSKVKKIKKLKKSKPPKIKVKVSEESKKKETPQPETEPKEVTAPNPRTGLPATQESLAARPETKVRKNALQIKKEAEEAEKELLEQEKIWEPPAFLRRKQNK